MQKGFTIIRTKNCRRYTKHVYEVSHEIDESFFSAFSVFGSAKITDFKKFATGAKDMFSIRSYDFDFEISGTVHGRDLIVTYKKKDREIMHMVESEIESWISEGGFN